VSLLDDFSSANVVNSLARAAADRLLEKGYLVYWHQIDAVQTPTLWYHAYAANQAAYLAAPAFAAELAAASGLVTIRADISALPRFVVRHTVDGTVPGPEAVPVPALAVELGPMRARGRYELGTGLQWRVRPLMVVALARDPDEQRRFGDWLSALFDEDAQFTVADHDGGSGDPVGPVRVDRASTTQAVATDDAEALTYQVLVNAFLEYIA
jgi:hypothetical protein